MFEGESRAFARGAFDLCYSDCTKFDCANVYSWKQGSFPADPS